MTIDTRVNNSTFGGMRTRVGGFASNGSCVRVAAFVTCGSSLVLVGFWWFDSATYVSIYFLVGGKARVQQKPNPVAKGGLFQSRCIGMEIQPK